MKCFAGSLGDQNGPQLIVDGRAVTMDFATPRAEHSTANASSSRHCDAASKGDWLCETVSQMELFMF